MGMEDRDWYREMHLECLKKRNFSKKSTPHLVIVLFWLVLLSLLFQVSKYLPPHIRSLQTSFRSAPVVQVESIAPIQQVNQQPEIHQLETPATQPDSAPIIQKQQQGSVTIYLCKAYSGGMFWSSAYCGTQQALIDLTATAPGDLPFDQQVQMAEAQRSAAKQLFEPTTSPVVPAGPNCAQLVTERMSIEHISEKMIWVPIEKQNANYHRMNQIKADMARLGCRY